MGDDPSRCQVPPSDDPEVVDGLVLNSPTAPPIVTDTANTGAEIEPPPPAGPSAGLRPRGRFQAELWSGPIPDPRTIKELVGIYPKAAEIIFKDFQAQGAHRRELERIRIMTGARLAVRGQFIGGLLGAIGLIGSLIVAGFGHGWAGFGIAISSLVSLVSVFVYGREEQKRERMGKAGLRERLDANEPIEQIEGLSIPDKSNPRTNSDPKT